MTKWFIVGSLGLAVAVFVGYPYLKKMQVLPSTSTTPSALAIRTTPVTGLPDQTELERHYTAVNAGEEQMRPGMKYPSWVRGNKP